MKDKFQLQMNEVINLVVNWWNWVASNKISIII